MSTGHRILGLLPPLALALSACAGGSVASDPAPSTQSTTTASPVTTATTPTSTAAPVTTSQTIDPELEVELPDTSEGVRLGTIGLDQVLWAVPDPDTTGCEGGPGWVVWSLPEAGDFGFVASPTVFATAPGLHYLDDGADGMVLAASCEEQSWQIVYGRGSRNGELVDQRPVQPPAVDSLAVPEVVMDGANGRVLFLFHDAEPVDDNQSASSRVVAVKPGDASTLVDDFVLGAPSQSCSADGMSLQLLDDDTLTPEALVTRNAILEAAVACDFDSLATLGLSDGFVYTFDNEQRGPFRTWALGEYMGVPFTERLVGLLDRGPATADPAVGGAVWPAVAVNIPAELDENGRQHLNAIGYDESEIDRILSEGVYSGYRTAIGDDGRWRWFVAGD